MNAINTYLFFYNAILCLAWAAVLGQVVLHYFVFNGCPKGVFQHVEVLLTMAQTAAVMEILHTMVGFVRSGFMTTFMQVFSRILVLWGSMLIGSEQVTSNIFFTQTIVAWALSEIIRYSYYCVNLTVSKEKIPRALLWLRYSAFLILYPIGISGEIVCMYNALPHVAKHNNYSISLPNMLNFSFSYYGFIWFCLIVFYPLGTWSLYGHMLAQRSKVLYGKKKE